MQELRNPPKGCKQIHVVTDSTDDGTREEYQCVNCDEKFAGITCEEGLIEPTTARKGDTGFIII